MKMRVGKKIFIILLNFVGAILVLILAGALTMKILGSYTLHREIIKVPSFSGLTPEKAEEMAASYKLRISVIDSIYQADAEPGTIIDQYPYPASEVKRNRMINVTINTIDVARVAMPNLVNTAFRQSVNKLISAGFKIGKIQYTKSDYRNLVVGFIYNGEEVKAGDMLPKGSTIDLILGNGNGNVRTTVPNVVGEQLSDARLMLLNSYLNVVVYDRNDHRIDPQQHPAAYVYRQYPESGTSTNGGATVSIYTSPVKSSADKLIEEGSSKSGATSSQSGANRTEIEFSEENDPGLYEIID